MTDKKYPPVRLTPMTQAQYERWVAHLAVSYAQDHVAAGNWEADTALEHSQRQIDGLLTDGLQTEGHHIFTINDPERGATLGHLWLKVASENRRKTGFIYDLQIGEPHRRKGYATAAMLALEEKARAWGLERLGLHVFGHNTGARMLYEGLGYVTTDLVMAKPIGDG